MLVSKPRWRCGTTSTSKIEVHPRKRWGDSFRAHLAQDKKPVRVIRRHRDHSRSIWSDSTLSYDCHLTDDERTAAQTQFAMSSLSTPRKDDRPRQQSAEAFVARSLIGISELDSRIQDQISEYGSIKDFKVMLWQQPPDATGSNWDARIYRIHGDDANNSSWWELVPRMRECFNLM